MEKSTFKIAINAPRNKVWEILWGATSYPEWTAAFAEGSKAVSDWQKGSKILFTNVEDRGMVAIIEEKIPNEFMSFKHMGEYNKGEEDLTSDKVKAWAGAHENYTLSTVDGKTELRVDMDLEEAYKDYFLETFPLALNKVKELSEQP